MGNGSSGSSGRGGSGTCADEDGNCRFYASYCSAENVKAVCKKTCGLCSSGTTTATTTTTTTASTTSTSRRLRPGTCMDEDGNCRFYTNYCSAENVKAVCKKTCGLCGTCADEDRDCRFYTRYCSADNVKAVGKKTCGLC